MHRMLLTVIAGALALGMAQVEAKEWKKVRIASEGAYPPFNLLDKDGKLQGFEIDLAAALCAEMKVECTLVKQDWDGMIPALQAKKFDAIMAGMNITEERKRTIDFSDPYYQTPVRFVAKKGSGLVISAEGLKGKTIGVQRETTQDRYVTDNYDAIASIKRYGTAEEAKLDLIAGRVDVFIDDSAVVKAGFLDTPDGRDYEFVGPSLTDPKWFGIGTGVGLRKSDPELKAMFNKAIAAIVANGSYKKIESRYFDFDISVKK